MTRETIRVNTFIATFGVCLWAWSSGSLAQDFSSVPGVVIANSPKSSNQYIGSPSIAVLPNGDYVATHDFFGPGSTEGASGVSAVYRSSDAGQTWTYLTELQGQFWSNLFVNNDALYIMGVNRDWGEIVIRKSTDNGATWTTPVDTDNGFLTTQNGYHSSAVPMVVYNGRIWRSFENRGGDVTWPYDFQSLVMSAPVDADLLKASSWELTNTVTGDTSWLDGEFKSWLEGNVVVTPDNELVNMLRVQAFSKSAVVRIDADSQSVSFDKNNDFVSLPGGGKKFTIRYDAASSLYWTIANVTLPTYEGGAPESIRNAAALVSSPDLRDWQVKSVELYHPDPFKHAFQYSDWQFEGDNIVAVSRTAFEDGLGGANTFHDSNLMTFYRIDDFRTFSPTHVLVADTSNNRILRYQTLDDPNQESWVPLGTFGLGASMTLPFGLAQASDGSVYVGEQTDGGRILRFDAAGNFLETVATEGIDFTGRPEALTIGPDGNIYMSAAFGLNSDKIYKIDLSNKSVSTFVDTNFSSSSLANPRGLAFAADGNLYVVDRDGTDGASTENLIRKFDGNTGAFLGNLATIDNPQGLTWDESGTRLVVSASADTDLLGISLDGTSEDIYSLDDIGIALGVEAVAGKVYWTDFNNGNVYESTGLNTRRTVVSGLTGPGHLLAVDLPVERTWTTDASGKWLDGANWDAFWGVANNSEEIAVFGSAISSSRTIVVDEAITVKGIRFLNSNTFAIAGNGVITFLADSGDATIDAWNGDHQFQVVVSLASNTDMTIASGASLSFNNTIVLNGNTLTKMGDGELNINGTIDTGGGSLTMGAGILSGNGTVTGALMNQSGVISPGNSPGKFTVFGDYVQQNEASLLIEIAGTETQEFDILTVLGTLHADGNLTVRLLDDFMPSAGDSFDILDYGTATGSFTEFKLPALPVGLGWDTSELMTTGQLRVTAIPEPSIVLLAFQAAFFLKARWFLGK